MIGFNKTKEDFGWLGNMSAHPIVYKNERWRTSEALFQALRFNDELIIDEIRMKASPMSAKMCAKRYRESMIVIPRSEEDLKNMATCLYLKFTQNPEIGKWLVETGDELIYENVEARKNSSSAQYWGAYLEGGKLVGQNVLGNLLMALRKKLSSHDQATTEI